MDTNDNSISEIISNSIVPLCGCDFSSDLITDAVFYCFPTSPHSAIYHAQLHSAPDTSVVELLAHLQEWASSGVSITVNSQHLFVNSFCMTFSSIPEEQCLNDALWITSTTDNTAIDITINPVSPVAPVSSAFIGMTVGITLSVILILLAISVSSAVIIVHRCRHSEETCNINSG